ncbi:hypothetical protein FPV67DRAFT_1443201 [Lyophyllum atratum]|nr:hypothetical protein FPV67DRAFT_1443201 [Lyophyllum atratum]
MYRPRRRPRRDKPLTEEDLRIIGYDVQVTYKKSKTGRDIRVVTKIPLYFEPAVKPPQKSSVGRKPKRDGEVESSAAQDVDSGLDVSMPVKKRKVQEVLNRRGTLHQAALDYAEDILL